MPRTQIGAERHPLVVFSRSPEIYDAVYSLKHYAAEANAVHELIQDRCPRVRTLLYVACGPGRHVERLRAWYEVEGVDLDELLLAVARARLPDVRLHEADMRGF